MNCPTCRGEMTSLGCRVTAAPFYWCASCGTMQTCAGDDTPIVAVPRIAEEHKRLSHSYREYAESILLATQCAHRAIELLGS